MRYPVAPSFKAGMTEKLNPGFSPKPDRTVHQTRLWGVTKLPMDFPTAVFVYT